MRAFAPVTILATGANIGLLRTFGRPRPISRTPGRRLRCLSFPAGGPAFHLTAMRESTYCVCRGSWNQLAWQATPVRWLSICWHSASACCRSAPLLPITKSPAGMRTHSSAGADAGCGVGVGGTAVGGMAVGAGEPPRRARETGGSDRRSPGRRPCHYNHSLALQQRRASFQCAC
jgi:hypothetical protein